MPKKGEKAPADAPAAQAQLPLGDGKQGANIEFSGSSQPVPLPLGGQSQPVMREPLAQAAGMGEGEEGSPAGDTALQPGNPPPTVTTIAPPQGVAAGSRADACATRAAGCACAKPVATQPAKPVATAAGPGTDPGRRGQAGRQAC